MKKERKSKFISPSFQGLPTVVEAVPSRSLSFVYQGAAPDSPAEAGWPCGCSPGSAGGQRDCPPSWKSLTAAAQCFYPNLHVVQLVCGVCVYRE